MMDVFELSEISRIHLQKLYDTVSRPSVHGDLFVLMSGQFQHGRIGRKNYSPDDTSTPSGFMSVQVDVGCDQPILFDKRKVLPENFWIDVKKISFPKPANEFEELQIYRWLNKTPPKNFNRVLSFDLFKRDIKSLKTYLPTQLKKNRVLNLVYFPDDFNFQNRTQLIVPDDLNWIFSQRGRVLFTDKKIYSEKSVAVIQKGLNIKIHRNKKHLLPLVSQFSADLFMDIETDNYECEFYTEKESREGDFGKWYMRLDNQKGIIYQLFSNPVVDHFEWIKKKENKSSPLVKG